MTDGAWCYAMRFFMGAGSKIVESISEDVPYSV